MDNALDKVQFEVVNQSDIPAHELPRIFDKFYRIPNADPWKQGGTGLGLALVKRLVEQLQGNIDVTSTNGITTFTVYLPLNPIFNAGLQPMS
jgi:signal transduction histidine kinase